MRSDRYRDMILTIIAAALIVIALPRLETPEVQAAEEQPPETATEEQRPQMDPRFTLTHVGPLRWRLPFVMGYNDDLDTLFDECHTAISVLNTSSGSTEVEVGFWNYSAAGVGVATASVAAHDSWVVVTATSPGSNSSYPFVADTYKDTGEITRGFAEIWADDPRILVAAFLVCKDEAGAGGFAPTNAMTTIPAYPVGVTAEYFQAGMPATWTPPMAAPEVPE